VHGLADRGRAAAAELPPLAPGVSWVRFGRETLLYSEDDEGAGAQTTARSSRGARYPRRHTDATREQLHVVVQHGRRFQQHHPDVPVLHDRGRFLLVQMDPQHARGIRRTDEMCYGVMPLTPDLVLFDERVGAAARAVDPMVTALIGTLTRPQVEATLEKLAAFTTRHSTSDGYRKAAAFALEQLAAMGYVTSTQSVTVGAATSSNVTADKAGTGAVPRTVVIVTAHLDSVNADAGPSGRAPGADDNASGSTGVLEIARVFRDHPGRQDLRFILFGGEEQGLFGSKQYLAGLSAAERSRISAVVNMDMIGSLNSPVPSVLLEGAALSQAVIDRLADAAASYTGLTVETSLHPFNSDHVPFIESGIPAVLTIEGSDNTNGTVHSADDKVENINYDLLLEILRMNVAFVAEAIDRVP
jgi:Peptidase family M28